MKAMSTLSEVKKNMNIDTNKLEKEFRTRKDHTKPLNRVTEFSDRGRTEGRGRKDLF